MAARQQGTRRKAKTPENTEVRAIRFDPEDLKTIADAADHEAQPFSVFVRSAALREARRVLQPAAAPASA